MAHHSGDDWLTLIDQSGDRDLGGPIVIVAYVVAMTYAYPPMFLIHVIVSMVVVGLCLPVEAALRPVTMHKQPQLPKRDKSIASTEAKGSGKRAKGVPSHAAMAKQLPVELRGVLKAPADRQPEAINHDRQAALGASV